MISDVGPVEEGHAGGGGRGLPRTTVQTCMARLLRNPFWHAAQQDWDKIAKALNPVYPAATEDAGTDRFMELADAWERNPDVGARSQWAHINVI
ncbi:transposase [Micromonospora sp. NPDC048930]|uniref:transposase n=1 Tax=Micromonospora sp. NPDC048930 TaxID=3364261 RepID=UPI00371630CA